MRCDQTLAADFERRAATRTFFRVGLMASEPCAVMIDSANADHALSAIGTPAELAQWTEQAGDRPVRIGGEPTWWLHLVTAQRLLEYDMELQLALPQHLSVRRRFRADVLRSAMLMHPHKVRERRTFVANPDYAC